MEPSPTTADSPRRLPWYARHGSPLVLVVGVLAYVVILQVMVSTDNINLFPTLLLVGSVTVPLSVLLLAWSRDRLAVGHGGVIAFTAIAGGIIGTTTAGLLEYQTLRALPWLGVLAVGVIEEAAKLVVPLLVFLAIGRRTPGLGIVVGIASGAGFAVLETMGYGLTALIESRGDVGAVDATLLLRGLLSPAGHVAWTGLVAWALWRLASRPPVRHGVRDLVGAYVVAVLLHSTWDGVALLAVRVVVVLVSLAILVVLVLRSEEAERRPSRAAREGSTPGDVPDV